MPLSGPMSHARIQEEEDPITTMKQIKYLRPYKDDINMRADLFLYLILNTFYWSVLFKLINRPHAVLTSQIAFVIHFSLSFVLIQLLSNLYKLCLFNYRLGTYIQHSITNIFFTV